MTNARTLCTFLLLLLCSLLGAGLAQAAPAAAKGEKDKDPPGIDTSGMTPSEKTTLRELLDKLPSPCGKAHSLATSLRTDPRCRRSTFAAKALQKWLKDGFLASEVEERYEARFSKKVYEIDVSGAAVRGDPKAPVTIVEFSDFECPHCKMVETPLKQLLSEYPTVRLVFLNFPLGMHQNAGPAAAAALAAGKQNKFWAYHDKLFENQGRLGPAELLRYAQELNLDLGRFQADMEGARARVARERAMGEKLELTGTPTFFINGRRFTESPTYENLKSWIDEELAK
jgi:protein-disulfide isomerase